jgi:leucine-zipper-like transcriptional regulator 1
MRNPWILPVVFAVILLACTKSPQQAGTMSETDTAMIYNPDNTPAVGAVVRFFVATDSTRTIAYQTTTDSNGRYSTKALTKGVYNLLAYSAKGLAKSANEMSATNDSLIAYQDSIIVLTDTVLVQPDTLEKPGSITGIIGLQPNHDPRTATVEVLGTNIYSNVDINGRFTLSPIAKGNYNLRLVTTLADYTPTYVTISTQGQKKDTLADTLWLLYTGIPVVTGLAASYDTVNGLVHLSWNKASYRDFQNYLIFRDAFDSINLSTDPIAACADTFFNDTIFKHALGSGPFSFSDTNDYHFKYRICIENNSTKRGDTYKYVGIVASSPGRVQTTFTFTFFHIAKLFVSDTASINDTLLCYVNLSNPTRQLKSLVWTDGLTGKTVRTIALDSTRKTAHDTLKCVWNTAGVKALACVVTDMAGTAWKDTGFITVVKNSQVVTMTYSPALIAVGDTIHLHMRTVDKYASVAKVEWDVGNTGLFSLGARMDSVIDTILLAPATPNAEYLCVVRITDDDGNVVLDTLGINVNMFTLVKDSAAFDIREGHSSVVFNNRMWVIAGVTSSMGIFSSSDSWYSEDGISWVSATQQASFQSRSFHTSVVFDNKIWVIGGDHMATALNDVWNSSDGSSWIQSTPAAQFSPRAGHASVVFDNKMWVIAGSDSLGYRNDVWYSGDGISWTLATANALFSPRTGHSSVVFDNKMWVIAGLDDSGRRNDVWNSSDGVTWTQATANAGFPPRCAHSSVVFDNKMWVIAGADNSGYTSDAWYSTDGATWIQASANAGFSQRAYHSSIVFDNKMWVIAGYSGNSGTFFYIDSDVWYSGFSAK